MLMRTYPRAVVLEDGIVQYQSTSDPKSLIPFIACVGITAIETLAMVIMVISH